MSALMWRRGPEHGPTLGYYGGPHDGRVVRAAEPFTKDQLIVCADYTLDAHGVHDDDGTLCWALLMYTPIADRGKLDGDDLL